MCVCGGGVSGRGNRGCVGEKRGAGVGAGKRKYKRCWLEGVSSLWQGGWREAFVLFVSALMFLGWSVDKLVCLRVHVYV